jgi:hypothetical protein
MPDPDHPFGGFSLTVNYGAGKARSALFLLAHQPPHHPPRKETHVATNHEGAHRSSDIEPPFPGGEPADRSSC